MLVFPIPLPTAAQLDSSAINITSTARMDCHLRQPDYRQLHFGGKLKRNRHFVHHDHHYLVLAIGRNNLKFYAYFASSTAALTDGSSHNIPSSTVTGSINSGSFAAFTGTSAFASGSSLQIDSQTVSGITLANAPTTACASFFRIPYS